MPTFSLIVVAARANALLRRWARDGRGMAAVEFAFIAPIMGVMFIGAVELSQACLNTGGLSEQLPPSIRRAVVAEADGPVARLRHQSGEATAGHDRSRKTMERTRNSAPNMVPIKR